MAKCLEQCSAHRSVGAFATAVTMNTLPHQTGSFVEQSVSALAYCILGAGPGPRLTLSKCLSREWTCTNPMVAMGHWEQVGPSGSQTENFA